MSWRDVHRIAKGQIAEYYAKIEFLKRGFEVYSAVADTIGIDFIAIDINKNVYKIQVKSCTDNNYQYIRADEFYKDERYFYIYYIRFIEEDKIEMYLIPTSAWEKGNSAFNYYSYIGKKTDAEYGINYSEKNKEFFESYKIENAFKNLLSG